MLRRSILTEAQTADRKQAPMVVGDLYIDPAQHTAAMANEPMVLTRQEFDLLLALARACERVKTREQLLIEVAERDFEAFDPSIDVHISSLRKKLGDDARAPRWIETIRGVGYMLKKPEAAA